MTNIDIAREIELVRKWLDARERCDEAEKSGTKEEHLKAQKEYDEAGHSLQDAYGWNDDQWLDFEQSQTVGLDWDDANIDVDVLDIAHKFNSKIEADKRLAMRRR